MKLWALIGPNRLLKKRNIGERGGVGSFREKKIIVTGGPGCMRTVPEKGELRNNSGLEFRIRRIWESPQKRGIRRAAILGGGQMSTGTERGNVLLSISSGAFYGFGENRGEISWEDMKGREQGRSYVLGASL